MVHLPTLDQRDRREHPSETRLRHAAQTRADVDVVLVLALVSVLVLRFVVIIHVPNDALV